MPVNTIAGQPCPALDAIDSPNSRVAVLDFWDPWASVVVNRGKDVERGKDTRDSETHHPDREIAPGTNPVTGDI